LPAVAVPAGVVQPTSETELQVEVLNTETPLAFWSESAT
jgi:hypothetical protein